ncbi:MAG: sugar kinase [Haloarculaceae archaeon]
MTRLVTFGETTLRFSPPDHQRIETADEMGLWADGTASSVAIAADRLGTPAVWISKVPDSPLGRRVVAELGEHGLDTDVVWADEGRQGLAFHERGRAPRSSRRIEDREGAAVGTATPGELPMTLVQQAETVLVSGATLALSPTARETAGAILRAATGTTVLELDYRPGLWPPEEARDALRSVLDAVDTLVANEDQIRTVFGGSGEPRELIHSLAADHDFERVVVTRSEYGAVAWDDSVIHEQSAIEADTVDPAGQHAAFVGGFLSALLSETPTDQALAYGVATAAVARTVPGPLPLIERDEVQRTLSAVGAA